ncbi:MAG: TonB-dependent receptor [Bacteroidales bacterium]|jgi:TonB-linked SusC/RagA family outer membrane protein|nr:TonB-dependent receptor [Bacteroidales bacterium]MCI1785713.1 TonB-dependent receptor [Bacteroidales bacterium]
MKKIKLFFTALLVLVATSVAFAQSGEVTGVVTDASTGETIAGTSVRVKGTMTGASAGADGTYSVKVASKSNAVLIFSFVGYKTVEVPVSGKNVVNVALEVDATALQDVVVVAYGTQKKEAVTGSISSVKGDGLASIPVTSVEKMLAGKLAGVSISSVTGQPGSFSQIRIRGISSINAGNSPLWVVDGIPILNGDNSEMVNSSNTLTMLNPNDIESITVLKDAAASAAYGSRAANGVILVTTKSGKEGVSSFSASAKFGVSWLQSDSGFRMMNARELLQYQRDAVVNAGMDPDDPTGSYYRPYSLLNNTLYDPLKEFTRIGKLQEYEISASGGNSRSKYFSSFNYQKNTGIAYGIDFSKIQGRVNASYKLKDNLETGVHMNLGYTEQNDVPMQSLYYANPIWAGETIMPWTQLKNPDGSYSAELPNNSYQNPRVTAKYDQQWDKKYRLTGIVNLKWTPLKNLDLETKDAIETSFGQSRRYWAPESQGHGGQDTNLQTYRTQDVQLTTSNTATYSNLFGGYHSLRVVLGQEAKKYNEDYEFAKAPKVDPYIPYPNTASQKETEVRVSFSNESMLSFFGIADYNFDNKYFLQATAREDGSSLFGEDNKWGLFWSVSGSWNVTKENFMKNVKALSLLKLRLSYGVNGNNNIDPYQAYGVYATKDYNGYVGMFPSRLENKILSWEKNQTWNAGVDFGVFDNRIIGSVDVYNRKTVDLLLTKQIPQTTGFSTIFSNAGSLRNRGVEVQLSGDILRTEDFLWSAGANIAFNKTKILDLGGDDHIGNNLRQVVGKSMYTYYLYDYYGVNPSNGEALWVTNDGTLTNQYSKARRYYAGSPEPKAIGGFNTSFQWKGLVFSAFFEFKAGNKDFIANEWSYLSSDGSEMTMNQKASATNYWKTAGDIGVNPKPVAGNTTNSSAALSDRWLEDASYLRVKDVTLSYSLPKTWVSKAKFKAVKIYVSGLNLYCFNDVDFWDPEQGVTGSTAGQYPLTKSLVGGIELSF